MTAITEPPTRVTELLQAWNSGDQHAMEPLAEAVQAQLTTIAKCFMRRERGGHTLEPAALVNEAYIRLVDQQGVDWRSRGHFYAIAAKMMRRILLDHARSKKALKRGGQSITLAFDEALALPVATDYSQLHEALEALEAIDQRSASIVELRFFGGMSQGEVAKFLGCSPRTVSRAWQFARAYLLRSLA